MPKELADLSASAQELERDRLSDLQADSSHIQELRAIVAEFVSKGNGGSQEGFVADLLVQVTASHPMPAADARQLRDGGIYCAPGIVNNSWWICGVIGQRYVACTGDAMAACLTKPFSVASHYSVVVCAPIATRCHTNTLEQGELKGFEIRIERRTW